MAWVLIIVDVEVGGKSIEDLTGVCEVGLKGVYRGMREGRQVEVEDAVAAREKVGDDMTASLS